MGLLKASDQVSVVITDMRVSDVISTDSLISGECKDLTIDGLIIENSEFETIVSLEAEILELSNI
jgi:hypothetical protein